MNNAVTNTTNDIINIQKSRALFSVDTYINKQVNRSHNMNSFVCLDNEFIKVLQAVHIEHRNQLSGADLEEGNKMTMTTTMSNLPALKIATRHIFTNKDFAILQDINKMDG